ncbi:MAG: small, acid-soluble spore protein, alpha/beta type [Bacillota bacterium]|uniref:Small, acid-soluble spore protein, alpha/beta type n=1 Tax=Thermanaerosceptrum fracticalcis TaxID=1712410 RepID=A0A7G6E6G4_THEFR|nr:small, acid-soluble spore protein, alpha/beta type [Thermanaerosceptrum fracticalcis]QNB47668.1 small, acid-soluble spore protein, alpha/beta type [Thermanaerosceptrum fracticalcis]
MPGEKEKNKLSRNKKKEPTPQELLKFEIAKELGLWEKIQKWGWAELSAEESGRIGGIMTRRMRQGNS